MAAVERVVIMVQENHTTDNYFRGLAPYGAPSPPTGRPPRTRRRSDNPHTREAYFEWLTGASTGAHVQFDTAAVLPYYLYLAITGAFLENHCAGFGTNSTANHLLIVGGQSPTLKNPSEKAPPLWDMPSLPGLAEANGVAWRAYAASNDYPVAFYTQLKGSPNVVPSSQFLADAKAGQLPALVLLWHNSPDDEHPPANVTDGMDLIWQSVDAVVQGGGWDETVFMLTWDDWGGYDDHVKTPVLEYTPDNVQLALGPRVPLLMFGGRGQARDRQPLVRAREHPEDRDAAAGPAGARECRGSTTTRGSPTSSIRRGHRPRRLRRSARRSTSPRPRSRRSRRTRHRPRRRSARSPVRRDHPARREHAPAA